MTTESGQGQSLPATANPMINRRFLLSAVPVAALAMPCPGAVASAVLQEDAALLALFYQWLAVMRTLPTFDGWDDDGFGDANEECHEIAERAAAIPAQGLTGILVKALFWAWESYGDQVIIRPAQLAALSEASANSPSDFIIAAAIIRDGMRLVPAIAALVREEF